MKGNEVRIYGSIGEDVDYTSFMNEFNSIEGDVTLKINSNGGSITEGLAMYNNLVALDKDVTVVIEGMAASMASIIAMAGKTVKMFKNSFMMIHNPHCSSGCGEADDLRKTADTLDKMRDSIVDIYKNKMKIDVEAIKDYMDKETVFTADEALALGLCDEIIDNFIGEGVELDNIQSDFKAMEAISGLQNKIESYSDDISNLNSKVEKRDELISKMQSDNDKLNNAVEEYQNKLQKVLAGGFTVEPEINNWKDALHKCSNDYVEARTKYPQAYENYMRGE